MSNNTQVAAQPTVTWMICLDFGIVHNTTSQTPVTTSSEFVCMP